MFFTVWEGKIISRKISFSQYLRSYQQVGLCTQVVFIYTHSQCFPAAEASDFTRLKFSICERMSSIQLFILVTTGTICPKRGSLEFMRLEMECGYLYFQVSQIQSQQQSYINFIGDGKYLFHWPLCNGLMTPVHFLVKKHLHYRNLSELH